MTKPSKKKTKQQTSQDVIPKERTTKEILASRKDEKEELERLKHLPALKAIVKKEQKERFQHMRASDRDLMRDAMNEVVYRRYGSRCIGCSKPRPFAKARVKDRSIQDFDVFNFTVLCERCYLDVVKGGKPWPRIIE